MTEWAAGPHPRARAPSCSSRGHHVAARVRARLEQAAERAPAECGWKDMCLESDLDSPSMQYVSGRTPARGPGAQTHVHTHTARVPGSPGFLHSRGKAGLAGRVSGLRCLSETSTSSPGWNKGHSADQVAGSFIQAWTGWDRSSVTSSKSNQAMGSTSPFRAGLKKLCSRAH